MDTSTWLLCLVLFLSCACAAPPTRKSSYGKPAHHDHHKEIHHKQEEQAWFNGQATEPPVEWPEEADEEDDDVAHHVDHHQQQQQQPNHHDEEGSAGPWVGLADGASWPGDTNANKKQKASWPATYGGKKNGNGKSKTTLAPTWPPKPIVPQGGWSDPSQTDDSLWPESPAIQLHKKFHGKASKQQSQNDDSLSSPQVPSWSDIPAKTNPWTSAASKIINGDSKLSTNGKKNGNGNHHHHHTSSNKPTVTGWDQVPTGYAHKRPTWTKKKDHIIKFKESKFSQTDYTAPADDTKNADGGWVEEDEEEAGWQEEEPKSWPTKKSNGNGHHHHHQQQQQQQIQQQQQHHHHAKKHPAVKGNGSGGPRSWNNGATQAWPRGSTAKNSKWITSNDGEGTDSPTASPGQHHHHHQSGSASSSLNNGWLDLQKELYLLKNKVRVSSSNGSWPSNGKQGNGGAGGPGSNGNGGWKHQQWSQDQEPFSSATKMVTKVVFAESLPKGEKMVMRWTPPVSYQVSH